MLTIDCVCVGVTHTLSNVTTGQPEGGREVEEGAPTAHGVRWVPPGNCDSDGGQEKDQVHARKNILPLVFFVPAASPSRAAPPGLSHGVGPLFFANPKLTVCLH